MTVWMPSEWARAERHGGGAEPVGGDPGEPGPPADPADSARPASGIPSEPRMPPDAEAGGAAGEGSAPLVKTPWPWFSVRTEEGGGAAPAEPVNRADLDPPTAVLPVIRLEPEPPAGPPPGVGVRPHPQGRQDEGRRSGGTGNGSPGDGGAGSGAGAVEFPGGTRGTGGDAGGSSAGDVPPVGGAAPLPKRVPRTPPPPFGAVTGAGGASLFEPPSRGPASKQLRPSAALPPAMPSRRGASAEPTPVVGPLTPGADQPADQPARQRADVGGLWAGAAAARGDERGSTTGEPGADRANRWAGTSRTGKRDGWDFTAQADPPTRSADPPDGWSGTAGQDADGRGDVSGSGGGWGLAAAEPEPVARRRDEFAAGETGRMGAGAREPAERGAREAAERERGERGAREAAERGGRETAERERGGREAAEHQRGAREAAERGGRETAERERGGREAAERERGERGAREAGQREATKEPTWDEVVASLDSRDRGRGTGAYEEDATEVLGPFDVGLWTLQGRQAGPAPERVRGRAAAREARDRTGDRDRRGQDGADRDPATVALAGGGGDDGPPPDRPTGGSGSGSGAAGRPHTRRDRVRTVIRGVAQTFITLGLVLLLFSVYEVWFTGILNGRTQDRLKSQLEKQWETGDDPVIAARKPGRPGAKVRSIPLGDGFALIYIPTFGKDYVYTVVEGTDPAELDEGPGHYPDSALPGEIGNFAVAGHRVGKGSPFLNLDKLRAGSPIVIRTKTYWYTYRVLGDPRTNDPTAAGPLGVPGMRIVSPANVGVIAPVPGRAGAKPTERLLTLTTCHPKFSARERLVIHAQLDGAPFRTSRGLPPALKG